jgi:hypothetical protein
VAQGDICDRSQEQLGTSDRGLVMFRRMLQEQIKVVQQGGDPINTFRDPEKNKCIVIGHENRGSLANYRKGSVRYLNLGGKLSPVLDTIDDLMMQGAEAAVADAGSASTKSSQLEVIQSDGEVS